MSFLDPAFLFGFLPITLLLFALAGRSFGSAAASGVLILATLVFCLPFGWPFVAMVAGSALVNHIAFIALARQAVPADAPRRTFVFVGTLVFNFALLMAVKYGVLFEAVPRLAPLLAGLARAIPVTISFFTFQRTVMLFDAYQRRPETLALAAAGIGNQLRLGAFSFMFPNLLIGPICYVSELGPQLAASGFGKLRRSDLQIGLTIMVIGLAKKVLIADPLDDYVVAKLFGAVSAGQRIVPIEAAAGVVAFYAQLYFDFSGYSDIAIGISRMLGLVLPINFNSPLRATGIVDFYKRWHITLTRVIAKLLFTPLAVMGTRFAMKRGLRSGRSRLFTNWLPFLVNFEVIGIWHGAKMTYVAFGLCHGIWFILETELRMTRIWKAIVKRTSATFRLRAGQAVTMVPLMLTFALFRSNSLTDFGRLLGSLTGNWLAVLTDPSGRVINNREPVLYIAVAFSIIWLLPNTYELMSNYRPGILTWNVPSTTPRWADVSWRPTIRWGVLFSLLTAVVIGSLNVPSRFVYGGF
jgi:alginate O-acetyltransferase complex protein AlgI